MQGCMLPGPTPGVCLRCRFKPCGCSKVRLHTDKVTGKSKGFAHVHFETEDGLDRWVGVWAGNRACRAQRSACWCPVLPSSAVSSPVRTLKLAAAHQLLPWPPAILGAAADVPCTPALRRTSHLCCLMCPAGLWSSTATSCCGASSRLATLSIRRQTGSRSSRQSKGLKERKKDHAPALARAPLGPLVPSKGCRSLCWPTGWPHGSHDSTMAPQGPSGVFRCRCRLRGGCAAGRDSTAGWLVVDW
jgi:hypothetical protein